MDFTRVARAYLKMRDARTALKRTFEEEDEKIKKKMQQLEATVLQHLNTNNMDSIRTEAGTLFRQEEITPNGTDWPAFYDWIAANDAFDALERRVKKTFIREFMEQNDGALPPGVTVFREYVVRVRRQ